MTEALKPLIDNLGYPNVRISLGFIIVALILTAMYRHDILSSQLLPVLKALMMMLMPWKAQGTVCLTYCYQLISMMAFSWRATVIIR
jgi:hypothetical protein